MNNDSGPAVGEIDLRRELELELIKIRAEAEAARLEARAAELELTIRRMDRSAEDVGNPVTHADPPHSTVPTTHLSSPVASVPAMQGVNGGSEVLNREQVSTSPVVGGSVATSFANWDAVRSAPASCSMSATTELPGPTATGELQSVPDAATDQLLTRVDAAHSSVRRPNVLDIDESADEVAVSSELENEPDDQAVEIDEQEPERLATPAVGFAVMLGDEGSRHFDNAGSVGVPLADVDIDPDAEAEDSQRKRSPAAMLVSTVLHVLILIALAAFSLRDQSPKDQVALAASVSNPSEVSMETFEIETSEPENEQTEPTPSETEYELSPLGEMKVTDFMPDVPPAPPAPATELLSSMQTTAASMALKSDSDAKIQFCGVEGGGNHFVYLVDSSGSMGSAFESARTELLKSIDVLKPEQRFYVVFFDAESDYMRLSDPNTNESRSVYATAENKQALKRWAMRITKDRGRAPYDPLKFALSLKPDVIFLLSDGEFPQGIEDLLKETNRVENLFGDSGPISIVHTIGYHSREGESRMRRIAEQNQGQYRHVPKP